LVALVGAAWISLFVPQVLALLSPERLVVERVELEYGVGLVPLVALVTAAVVAWRRGDLAMVARRARPASIIMSLALLVMFAFPILVNFDGFGIRSFLLATPVMKSMTVMLRFWFAYVPVLCVLTGQLLDYILNGRRSAPRWALAGMVACVAQSLATDMRYYHEQPYDPRPIVEAHNAVRAGSPVPAISRIADPWLADGKIVPNTSSRNDAVVGGVSAFPCYEPMFGYRMEVFVRGRMESGPVLEIRDGRVNLKNPACYVFPDANNCRPGDEFLENDRLQAAALAAYKPFDYNRPPIQTAAGWITLSMLVGGALVLVAALARTLAHQRRD
jgi:hypothetical protein